jgi:outer membrane protein assembly factor BamB
MRRFATIFLITMLLLASAVTFITSGEATSPTSLVWPMFQHDPSHTGLSPFVSSSNLGLLRWGFGARFAVESSPAIGGDGTIYVGSQDANLYAINPHGNMKWKFTTGGQIQSSPAIAVDGTIYVGSEDGNLYAVHPDGSKKWAFATAGVILFSSAAIAADGTIYIGSSDGNLYAVNPSDGSQKWKFTTANIVNSSPAIGADGTIYIGSEDKAVYAINPNGSQKWKFVTGGPIDMSPAIASDGTIYIASADGNLYALHPAKGRKQWKFVGVFTSLSPAIGADGTIYVGGGDLFAIGPGGKQKWRFPAKINRSAPVVSGDGAIFVGSDDDSLYAVNPNGTQKWRFANNAVIESSPAIGADGAVYFGADNGAILAVGSSVSIVPGNVSFDAQSVGTSSTPQQVTLSNFQNVTMNISSLAFSGDFALSSTTCGGSLAAQQSCTISFFINPSAAYGRSGTLTVTDDASNSPQTASLYGVGIPAGVPQWGGFPASPFLTFEGIGSSAFATSYYRTIDPMSRRTTLGKWWAQNGFDSTGGGGTRTAYLNNNDLGFGRDMHCQQQGLNVACYVTNYGDPNQDPNNANLALTANKSQAGATVAMEYKPIEGQTTPIVKFFVFGGGAGKAPRVTGANLDAFGLKFVPNLCLNCHGGVYAPVDPNHPTAQEVNMGSSFREFDLASFRYPTTLPRDQQEPAFKLLNQMVENSNPAPAIEDLIDGWYANNSPTENSNFVPTAWTVDLHGVPSPKIQNLYQTVVAGSCRTCHTAQRSVSDNSTISWATYAEFQKERAVIQAFVCNPSSQNMPHALVTYNNFWLSNRPAALAAFSDGTDWPPFGSCN